MTYLQKNSRKSKINYNRKLIFGILFFLVLLLGGSQVKGVVHWVNSPLSRLKNVITTPFQSVLAHVISKEKIIIENKELIEENKKLKIDLLLTDIIQRDNDELKQIVEYGQTPTNRNVARVLNKPPFSPYDTFTIDVGKDNVSVGEKIYIFDIYVGNVEEVYPNSSLVRLFSSPNQTIQVSVALDYPTEAEGCGSGSFSASLPKDIKIQVGDIITHQNNLIGVVESIKFIEHDAFQKIYFSYPFKLSEVNWVEFDILEK